MTRSRFTEEQIIGILREQESGQKTADVCRRHGTSEATFYKYNAKFGGMDVSDARKLKALEDENAKLKKLLCIACRATGARREAAAHLCGAHGVSQRRTCAVLVIDRSSVRYQSLRPDDADLREAMKKVAGERRRFCYRCIHLMLERQGIRMNQKKLRRLYREEKLQVRKRGGPEASFGHQTADGAAKQTRRAMEPGLRVGCLSGRPPFPGSGRECWLQPRVPGAGRRYLVIRLTRYP